MNMETDGQTDKQTDRQSGSPIQREQQQI